MASYNKYTRQVKTRLDEIGVYPDATLSAIDEVLKGHRKNEDDFYLTVRDSKSVIENAEREKITREESGRTLHDAVPETELIDAIASIEPEARKEVDEALNRLAALDEARSKLETKVVGKGKSATEKATKAPRQKKTKEPKVKKERTQSNFALVASGICPHDSAKLGDEIAGKGIGVTRVCESCAHIWYLNKKIRTCKCLSCSADKRKAK